MYQNNSQQMGYSGNASQRQYSTANNSMYDAVVTSVGSSYASASYSSKSSQSGSGCARGCSPCYNCRG